MTNPDAYNPKILNLEHLLDCWNFLACQCVRMIPSVERALFEWNKLYTKADLEVTLKYINYRNRRSDHKWQLRFEKFFDGDYSHFESIRAEAEQHYKALAAKRRQILPEQSAVELAQMRHEQVKQPEQPVKRISADFLADSIRKGLV